MTIDGINLTKLTNTQLRAIVVKLTSDFEVKDHYDFLNEPWNTCDSKSRPEVRAASRAIDAWKHVNTTTTFCEPSDESKAWSNLEGGHRFHQVPVFTL